RQWMLFWAERNKRILSRLFFYKTLEEEITMLKVGLIGVGFMGRMHFDNYERLMQEGKEVKLVAICDIQIETLKNAKAAGNMATDKDIYDLSSYNLYEKLEDMLANEELDMIDITLPTYLHADLACSLLEKG